MISGSGISITPISAIKTVLRRIAEVYNPCHAVQVPFESRVINVPYESRAAIVPFESRTAYVPFESRKVKVTC